jgi:hypothetical protein
MDAGSNHANVISLRRAASAAQSLKDDSIKAWDPIHFLFRTSSV